MKTGKPKSGLYNRTPKAVLFSAPSGSGKTTIIKEIMRQFDCFEFSISATSRLPRRGEVDGVDYYFLSAEEFKSRADRDLFLEWEEVYNGTYYGTLKSEIDRIVEKGKIVVFDVDVKGGVSIKNYFGNDALALFIMPPSIEELERRLRNRGTENEESISKRLARASQEMEMAPKFDVTIVNDNIDVAVKNTIETLSKYIGIGDRLVIND